MNKKQGVVIITLLALIVCAGVLATRLRSPLYVNGSDTSGTNTISNQSNNATTNSDYFAETKLTRDKKDTETLQTLKLLMDDTNVSKENRDDAAKKYTILAMNNNYESKIETTLKSKGYEEVICSVEDNKARIIIKGKTSLTDKETREIKDVVLSISKLKSVEIEVKQ